MIWANEIDRYCADWLRNLFPGIAVDERSIADLEAGDVRADRSHFFAGVGGWEYALRLAGWPADRPVWTGSCPCQPFSAAGKRRATDDARHLWPTWRRLIEQLRPATIFGEQVASDLGRVWLSGVRADLELLGYAVGCADLCAPGVGAPHMRQRLFWVADSAGVERRAGAGGEDRPEAVDGLGLGYAHGERREGLGVQLRPGKPRSAVPETGGRSETGGLVDSPSERGRARWARGQSRPASGLRDEAQWNPWADAIWVPCLDGKARRIEPGLEPLAHGVSARVGRLRAYGNAIVPQVAAAFVGAFLEAENQQ